MKTYIADIIPKIQRFSQQLGDLTKLTNQHWVSLGDISQTKRVFIFRANNQLLISENGIVEKGAWEYLGNQSLLIETKQESYLLKHGFFDQNVIALKLDSTDSYAFFVNETKYHSELNNIKDILKFLENKYLLNNTNSTGFDSAQKRSIKEVVIGEFETDKGIIKVELNFKGAIPAINNRVFQNDKPAENGKYKLGFMDYIVVKNGIMVDNTLF
jgi:hypothetical protein